MRVWIGWLGLAAVAAGTGCGDDSTSPSGSGGGSGGGSTAASAASTSSTATSASGSTAAGTGGAGEGGGTGGGAALDITWEPCPLDSDGGPGRTVECATIQVPSKWDEPGSSPIDFFLKRVPAAEQPARAQLWYLNGGPGYSGADFDGLADLYADLFPDVDQYIPDHRGTGRSSRLGCAAEDPDTVFGTEIAPEEWPDCLADVEETWGEALDGFTMSNAARDVGEVIEATRAEDQQVIVLGGSYGTALANRYLAIYPDQPTSVILGAIAVNTHLDDFDRWFDALGERWMERCAENEECAARLGPDPWATMTAALDDFDDGACQPVRDLGYDRTLFQQLFATFFYYWNERSLIAPMVYRLARCDDDDVEVFSYLFDGITAPQAETPSSGYFSRILAGHISLAELWSDPGPTVAELEAFRATANVANALPEVYASAQSIWPIYPLDEYAGVLAPPAEHMLMFDGELDFIPAEAVADVVEHFEGESRPFAEIARSPHTLFSNPVGDEGYPCGGIMVEQVVADPLAEVDTSCKDEVRDLPFDVPAQIANIYLGVDDEWDGAIDAHQLEASVHKPSPSVPWHIYERLGAVRARLWQTHPPTTR